MWLLMRFFMGIVYDHTGWLVWFLGVRLCVGRLGLMGWRFWQHGFGREKREDNSLRAGFESSGVCWMIRV